MNAPISSTSPLHQRSALDDLDSALYQISRLADALSGIGHLLQPEHGRADEQLNLAHRSGASAVFEFFGEVLNEYRDKAVCAHNTLQQEAEHASRCHAQGGAA